MKNLVIAVAGDDSLHRYWKDHDLFIVYYGKNELKKEQYKSEATYFWESKGTKFNIIHNLYKEKKDIINKYDYIFIPDDDLFINSEDITRLFQLTNEYHLLISQPAIIGYYSLPVTLPVPCNILRYTNYVEIMCPCFEKNTFFQLHETFNYNKSCWGIDLLWNYKLGQPKDKLAIIDDIVAIHTRPVYKGDNYSNNQIKNAYKDILDICEKFNITHEKVVYNRIEKSQFDCEKNQFIFPNTSKIKEVCQKLRRISLL